MSSENMKFTKMMIMTRNLKRYLKKKRMFGKMFLQFSSECNDALITHKWNKNADPYCCR